MIGVVLSLLAGCGPAVCNGSEALCDRPLDEVAFPATHNSMSNEDEGWRGPNQLHGIAQQLDDGVRGFLIDTYTLDGVPSVCHGLCELGSEPLSSVWAKYRSFLDEHPAEFLVFVIQDTVEAPALQQTLVDAGLFDRVMVPPTDGVWPTLGELLEGGLQMFVSRESGGDGPAWYPPFYELAFDTPYDFRTADDFSCDVLRGKKKNDLFQVNHWLSTPLPTRDGAAEVNVADVLGARVEACEAQNGHMANVVAVNHYDLGDLFEVVAAINAR